MAICRKKKLGQACDGSLHPEPFKGRHTLEKYTRADNFEWEVVSRRKWQAAVDALKAGEQAWNGEGLPPVGTVCEVHHQTWADDLWETRKILWIGKTNVVTETSSGSELNGLLEKLEFRPIRTAEQIAAEERAAEVAEMINLATDGHQAVTIAQARILCTQLHKAGYRKQVQP